MSLSALESRLLRDEPLAKYTACRMGGKADYLYLARESVDDIAEVVSAAWAEDMPVRVLGGGANVLVSDAGFRGLIVINRVSEIAFGDWHEGRSISATSGTSLSVMANRAQRHGLTGFEWAVNVPGTVGGAVVNNAGAHGGDMQQSIADVVVLEPTGPKLYTNADLGYAYRHSVLKARSDRRFLVLLATFTLTQDDPAAIKARMKQFIAHRKQTQPPGASLGSIFKNPPGDYAGRLIETSGLKGHQIGSAMVSPVHANFIVNSDARDGRADDYYALIRHVQTTVEEMHGVKLELEVELVGNWFA